MKKVDESEWATSSKPLIKSPGQENCDIMAIPCSRCGVVVQHIKGKPVNHKCVRGGNQFGYAK